MHVEFVRRVYLKLTLGIFLVALSFSPVWGLGQPDQGKDWYFKSGCDSCHGKTGGDGPVAAALDPKPPGFCASAMHPTDDLKFKMIAGGGAKMNHSPQMPAWGSVLDRQAISDIVAYINSLCRAVAITGNPEQGKKWYVDAGCDGCHGKRGRGDGPAAVALNPRPADFCTSAKHPTDDLKFKMIVGGGAKMGHSPAMPAWGHVLDEQAIWDLIAHMHTLCKK